MKTQWAGFKLAIFTDSLSFNYNSTLLIVVIRFDAVIYIYVKNRFSAKQLVLSVVLGFQRVKKGETYFTFFGGFLMSL